jgi:hypothetical protein
MTKMKRCPTRVKLENDVVLSSAAMMLTENETKTVEPQATHTAGEDQRGCRSYSMSIESISNNTVVVTFYDELIAPSLELVTQRRKSIPMSTRRWAAHMRFAIEQAVPLDILIARSILPPAYRDSLG